MSILNHKILTIFSMLAVFAALQLSAQQQAPYGSCMLDDGLWCWPLVPGAFGDPCVCPTPDGDQPGTIQ
jgi:hypothetical protein